MSVTLVPATKAEVPWLKTQLQAYLDELSAFTVIETNTSGDYHYPYFEHYWKSPDRHPYIIQARLAASGFILAREEVDPSNGQRIMEIAEAYILPDFRRQSIASRAVNELVKQFPGKWRVCVLPKNLEAYTFWRQLIAMLDSSFEESTPGPSTNEQFVFSFRTR